MWSRSDATTCVPVGNETVPTDNRYARYDTDDTAGMGVAKPNDNYAITTIRELLTNRRGYGDGRRSFITSLARKVHRTIDGDAPLSNSRVESIIIFLFFIRVRSRYYIKKCLTIIITRSSPSSWTLLLLFLYYVRRKISPVKQYVGNYNNNDGNNKTLCTR